MQQQHKWVVVPTAHQNNRTGCTARTHAQIQSDAVQTGRRTDPTYICFHRAKIYVYVHHFEAIFWVFPEGNLFIVNCIFLFYLCLTDFLLLLFLLVLLSSNRCVPHAACYCILHRPRYVSFFSDCFSNTIFIQNVEDAQPSDGLHPFF